jgi:hypothetical protein
MVTDAQIGIALEAFDQKAGYSKIEKMRAALEAAMSAAEPHPAPSVAVKDLEWEAIGTRMFVATTPVGVNYQLQEFSSWTNNPFQLVVREADDGNTKVSFYLTLDEAKVAAQADYEARILSALSAQVQEVATHRHKKRGTEYVLMGVGKMQAENWQVSVDGFDQSIDMREVAIYRSVDDGSLWVRPIEEFNDGRFEALPAAPAKQEG